MLLNLGNNSKKGDIFTHENERGMGWIVAGLFLVAELVGSGVVALPANVNRSGAELGAIYMVTLIIFFAYTAHELGECWVIMQDRWPDYRTHCRKPYAEIALRSMGQRMRNGTEAVVYITQFGCSIVFLLLSSQILQSLLASWSINFSICYLLIIVTACILPATFLKSPADFWWLIMVALIGTVLTTVLVLIGTGLDHGACIKEVNYPRVTFIEALFSVGTFMFALCAHAYFPTLQHDMRRPQDFTKSVIIGYILVGALYMPLALYAYIVYGDSIHGSVLNSIQTSWIRDVGNIGIGIHCILTFIITQNPLHQKVEHVFKAPHKMCIKRVVIRTSIVVAALFCALTMPDFSPVMDVIGSTLMPTSSVFFPILFNMWMKSSEYDETRKEYVRPTIRQVFERTSKVKLAWNALVCGLTLIGSSVALYMAVKSFITVKFTPPCYVRPFLSTNYENFTGVAVSCCGKSGLVSAHGDGSFCHL